MVVAHDVAREPARSGLGADEDEQAGGGDAITRSAGSVGDLDPLEAPVATTIDDFGVGAHASAPRLLSKRAGELNTPGGPWPDRRAQP